MESAHVERALTNWRLSSKFPLARQKLEQRGATVVGPAANVQDALELLATSEIDEATLDVHLGDEFVFPVGEKLDEANIPFVFATRYFASVIPAKFSGFTLCEKSTVLGSIASLLFSADGGAALN